MKIETILNLPDTKEKFLKLERALLKLQFHGGTWFKGLDEYHRLFKIYRNEELKNDTITVESRK